jgi:NitT/TauT family transport system substrate-binding protein
MKKSSDPGLTSLGKIISIVLVLGLIALGLYVMKKKPSETAAGSENVTTSPAATIVETPPEGLSETQTSAPPLGMAEPYHMEQNILDVDISEYPGYAGLIVANGGLEPTENSVFFKNSGFKVRIKLSEEESWSALNSGKVGVSVTTTDVLAVLGKQFQVTVPLLIGYSRGADAIVVTNEIKRLNQLQGKIVLASQFTESDFFIRYLAQEAGLPVAMLDNLQTPVVPDAINLVYAEEGETVAKLFLEELASGNSRIAACSTWAPYTTQAVDQSKGKARTLTSNRNLLIVSDIAVVNRAFAQANPKIVSGLVEGWLEGNKRVRSNPEAHASLLQQAFKWSPAQAKSELQKVHLANVAENLAYFSGDIDAAGSFGGIYQSAVQAYGSQLIPDAPPSERFMDDSHLKALAQNPKFAEDKIELAPIKSGGPAALESDPLLTKDIRFYFDPNQATLIKDLNSKDGKANQASLEDVAKLVRVSPGSTIVLMGHVDDSLVSKFTSEGPTVLNQMRLKAVQLSKERAQAVKASLTTDHKIAPDRILSDGKGWEKPVSKTNPELNRRVEVQWFTVE